MNGLAPFHIPKNWKTNRELELESLGLALHKAWKSINVKVVQWLEMPNIKVGKDSQIHLIPILAVLQM